MLMYSMCMEIRTRGGKHLVRLNFCEQVVMEFLAPMILVATLAANTGIDNHHVLAVLQSLHTSRNKDEYAMMHASIDHVVLLLI